MARARPARRGDLQGTARLSARQRHLLPHLLTAPSVEAAARDAGLDAATLWRWLRQPGFSEAVERARRQATQAALNRLAGSLTSAVDRLRALLESPSPHVQVSAAKTLLEHALRAIAHGDLEQRIEALERAVKEREG
jgi:molybdenum-dependent DNA-binding transcriptional regulator ModE